MLQLIAIAVGGAFGSVARYGVSMSVYGLLGRGFPYGTLVVNVLGSFAMGLLTVLLLDRAAVGPEARAAVLIGFLGGFTTFSAFSIETLSLLQDAKWLAAGINAIGSVSACLGATWLGLWLGRQL
jgi:CrcB protein